MWDATGWMMPGYWDGVTHYNMIPIRYFCHPIVALPLAVLLIGSYYWALGRAIWQVHKEGWPDGNTQ